MRPSPLRLSDAVFVSRPRCVQICDDMKRKPYDLLDYTNSAFDRDYLEFNVQIHELETTLQGFINSSFENITSTDNALNLLKMFQAILQRDSLKADLDDKARDQLLDRAHQSCPKGEWPRRFAPVCRHSF